MVFGYDNQYSMSVIISDPAGDKSLPVWQVPSAVTKIEILEAEVLSDTALSAGTVNGRAISLLNGGTAGDGTDTIAAAVGTATGGTHAAWTANTPKAFTISEGTMTAGQWLVVKYDETGTDAPLNIVVNWTYVHGIGA